MPNMKETKLYLENLHNEIKEFDGLIHQFKTLKYLLLGYEIPTGTWYQIDSMTGTLLQQRQDLINKYCSVVEGDIKNGCR